MAKAITLKITADSSEFDAAFKRAAANAAALGQEIKSVSYISNETNKALMKERNALIEKVEKEKNAVAAAIEATKAEKQKEAELKKSNATLEQQIKKLGEQNAALRNAASGAKIQPKP